MNTKSFFAYVLPVFYFCFYEPGVIVGKSIKNKWENLERRPRLQKLRKINHKLHGGGREKLQLQVYNHVCVTTSRNTYRYTLHTADCTFYVFHMLLLLLCYFVALGSIDKFILSEGS